jgi:hypothetical protein
MPRGPYMCKVELDAGRIVLDRPIQDGKRDFSGRFVKVPDQVLRGVLEPGFNISGVFTQGSFRCSGGQGVGSRQIRELHLELLIRELDEAVAQWISGFKAYIRGVLVKACGLYCESADLGRWGDREEGGAGILGQLCSMGTH